MVVEDSPDCYKEQEIVKGTILYQGDRRKHVDCLEDIFRMVGQRGKTNTVFKGKYVGFFAFDRNTAKAYAGCKPNEGYTHKFIVKENIPVYKLEYNCDPELYDTEDVAEIICNKKDGLYILYEEDSKKNELAICEPEKFLSYIESQRCDGVVKNFDC